MDTIKLTISTKRNLKKVQTNSSALTAIEDSSIQPGPGPNIVINCDD